MMDTIYDEKGIQINETGMDFQELLMSIPNITNIMCEIAEDTTQKPETRVRAIFDLSVFFCYHDTSYYQSLLQNEHSDLVNKALHSALEECERGLEET